MKEAVSLSFIIGFLVASPVGPMGLLCLRRAIFKGFTSGILSALGVSCAYLFWAYVASHGLVSFSQWIERERQPLEIAIGLFFILYGLHAIFNSPTTDYPTLKSKGRLTEFFSTFLVVVLNPATFALFTVLFTLFGIVKKHFGFLDSLAIAFSVFAGAVTFWIAAAYSVQKIKDKIDDALVNKISRISAVAILAFGMGILLYAI